MSGHTARIRAGNDRASLYTEITDKIIAELEAGRSEPMRDRLRAYGLFGEIISWKLRFFGPVDATGPAILAKVLECYPIARIADRMVA
jgi:hypothetical protein